MTGPIQQEDKPAATQPAEETTGIKTSSQAEDDVDTKLAQGWTKKTEWKLHVVVNIKRVGNDPKDDDPTFAEIWGDAFLLDKDDELMGDTVRGLPERKHRVLVDYGEGSKQHSVTSYDLKELPGKAVVVMKENGPKWRDLGEVKLTVPVPAPGATAVQSETAIFGNGAGNDDPSKYLFSAYCDANLVTEWVPAPVPKWKMLVYIDIIFIDVGEDNYGHDETGDMLWNITSYVDYKGDRIRFDYEPNQSNNGPGKMKRFEKSQMATTPKPPQFFVHESSFLSLPDTIGIQMWAVPTSGGAPGKDVGRQVGSDTLQVEPIRSGATFFASRKYTLKEYVDEPSGSWRKWAWHVYYELYRIQ